MPSYDYNLIFEDNWAGHMSIVTIYFATELLPIVVAIEATVLILTDSFLGSILVFHIYFGLFSIDCLIACS